MRDGAPRARFPPSLPRVAAGFEGAAAAGKAVAYVNANEEHIMQWVDPAFCDIRLGFEVTAYVYVR